MSPPCQYCRARKGENGVKLFTCAGCKIELYCSKACQRAAWPTHKAKCKANRQNLAVHEPLKALRAFSQKNFPHIVAAGVHALGLRKDITLSEREFLLILVTENDFGGRKATSFFVTSTSALTFADGDTYLGPGGGARAQQQRHWTLAQQNRPGVPPIGVFLAVIMNTDAKLINVMPVGFDPRDWPDELVMDNEGENWTHWLWKKMNVDVLGERIDQMVDKPGYSKGLRGLLKELEDPETLAELEETVKEMKGAGLLPPPMPDPDPEESAQEILAMFKKGR